MGTTLVPLRDGAALFVAISGSGPAVILCHGGPGLWDYLAPLAELLGNDFTVVRFDQRGCGRSSGTGPFTITQAIDDLDQLREALGYDECAVIGHSWGAELALRYAARHGERTTAVGYLCGVGSGNGYRQAYVAERDRRLGADRDRWKELGMRRRTPEEEREWCLLQWRPDFSPPWATENAEELWRTRPSNVEVNLAANRELSAERDTEDLLHIASVVTCPVLLLLGADDPRPWSATNSLLAALPCARRVVIHGAGHAPWAEQPQITRRELLNLLASGEAHRVR